MREGPFERPWLVRSRLFILERPSEGGQEVLAQTAATPAKTLTVFPSANIVINIIIIMRVYIERERERESLAREFYLKNPTPPGAAHAA